MAAVDIRWPCKLHWLSVVFTVAAAQMFSERKCSLVSLPIFCNYMQRHLVVLELCVKNLEPKANCFFFNYNVNCNYYGNGVCYGNSNCVGNRNFNGHANIKY